jgi:hypothetical protein
MDYDDPPPYEEQPLIRPPRVPVECHRLWNRIRTILDPPTCFIAVFCAGSIILFVSVIVIVVLDQFRYPIVTTITTTTTTTTTTTSTTTTRPGQCR